MIRSLTLENFRKYEKYHQEFNSPIVILVGQNARGKTTLLEAIGFVANGHSAWSTDLNNLFMTDSPHLRVEIECMSEDGEQELFSIYLDPTRRVYTINGKRTLKARFHRQLAATIFSPEQIELLMLSPDIRRQFLNQLISRLDPEYAEQLQKMRRVLKQRNSYLKRLTKQFYESGIIRENDPQLKYWDEQFAYLSAQIMSRRSEYLDRFQTAEIFIGYQPSLTLNLFEEMTDTDQLATIHMKKLEEGRKRDIATGHTNIGAHRDDWVLHAGKDVKRFGSRGEKRMAIGRMILKSQDILAKELGFYPTLLLDDISSELDNENLAKILSDDQLDKQQLFVSTITTEHFPEKLMKRAQIIQL